MNRILKYDTNEKVKIKFNTVIADVLDDRMKPCQYVRDSIMIKNGEYEHCLTCLIVRNAIPNTRMRMEACWCARNVLMSGVWAPVSKLMKTKKS